MAGSTCLCLKRAANAAPGIHKGWPAKWHVSYTEPCLHKLLSVLPLMLLLLQLFLPGLLPGGCGSLHCFRELATGLLRLCLQPLALLLQCTGGD